MKNQTSKHTPIDLVNCQGYLFQLGIEERLKRDDFHALVSTSEHPWRYEGENGFIDIVAENVNQTYVMDCKKSNEGQWVFLLPRETEPESIRSRFLWTRGLKEGRAMSHWEDFYNTGPPFFVSAFSCIRFSDGSGKTSLLETHANTLIKSTEALAAEELSFEDITQQVKVYIPTIVTNATLQICRYDPKKVSMETGKVEEKDVEFEVVTHLVFQKTLVHEYPEAEEPPANLAESRNARVRGVLVINASAIPEILSRLRFIPDRGTRLAAWYR